MSSPCRPWVQWGWPGEESEHEFELPQFPWTYAIGGVGGSDTAASGIPESYSHRDDEIVLMRWRVRESELPVLKEFLRWARNSGETFEIRLDADDLTTQYTVYLNSQRWEDAREVQFERDEEYRDVFIFSIAVRTSLGEAIDVSWWDLASEPEEA